MPRRIMFFGVLILIAGLSAGSCGRAPSGEAALSAAAQLIRPEALRAHAEFLADDSLEGRGTESRGHDLAVKYLRAQFTALGLRSGAEDGGCFQQVPFRRSEVETAAASLVFTGKLQSLRLVYGTDYAFQDTHASQEGEFSGPVARQAAAEAGLEVTPDPWPEEVMFVRQDAYPFILKGVPALYVDTGVKSLDPEVDGLARLKKWMATFYHSPKDDMNQSLDFESGVRFSRFVFRLCYAVANSAGRPKWNEGDFFGERFGASNR